MNTSIVPEEVCIKSTKHDSGGLTRVVERGELEWAQHISNTQSNCCAMISHLETLRSRRIDPKKYRIQDWNVFHYRQSLPRKEVREERTISAAGSRRRLLRRRRGDGGARARARARGARGELIYRRLGFPWKWAFDGWTITCGPGQVDR